MRAGNVLAGIVAAILSFGQSAIVDAGDADLKSTAALLDNAIAGAHRTPEFVARDIYRHPKQTLQFFEVSAELTVVEIWPGGKGWYTEILAPLLRGKGRFYAAQFPADSPVVYFSKSAAAYKERLAALPTVYDQVIITELAYDGQGEIAPAESADRVLTFRNIHNWMRKDSEVTVMQTMYRTLKPGGILGVVEHRAKPDTSRDVMVKSGYVTEAYVISTAKQAGFVLIDRSEINANPGDSASHPEGVWTLPPSLRLGDEDRAKYLAIGESDRMTLKFRKPQ